MSASPKAIRSNKATNAEKNPDKSFSTFKDYNLTLDLELGTVKFATTESAFFTNSKYTVEGEVSRANKYANEPKSRTSFESVAADGQFCYQGSRDNEFIPHGHGMMQFPSGEVYVGRYKKGVREGRGSYSYSDGSLYLGDWKAELREGTGIMNYSDGSMYDGFWVADMRHGWGRYEFSNGDIFEGEFKNDVMHGTKCLYSFSDPPHLYYLGPFVKNKIHWSDCADLGEGRLYISKGVAVVNRLLFLQQHPGYDVEKEIKSFNPNAGGGKENKLPIGRV